MLGARRRQRGLAFVITQQQYGEFAMSWQVPEPPVYSYWKGIIIVALAIVIPGVLLYLLLG